MSQGRFAAGSEAARGRRRWPVASEADRPRSAAPPPQPARSPALREVERAAVERLYGERTGSVRVRRADSAPAASGD